MRCVRTLVIATLVAAQEPSFDVQSRLVLVPVNVSDRKGRSVDSLGASDFAVFDNGRRQPVVVDSFATGVAPIALVVAVQSSGISAAALAKVQKIGAMIQPLITGERGAAALVSFDETVHWHQDFTRDPDALARAFYKLRPGAGKSACLLDAVTEAIDRLNKRSNARRVLLLISESKDRDSETGLDTVVLRAQTAGVPIYAATYSAFRTAFTRKPSDMYPERRREGPPLPSREPESPAGPEKIPIPPPDQRLDILGGIGELIRLGKAKTTHILAEATGGTTFSFTRQKGLEEAIEKLGAELHTQYVLSFTPEAPAPGYHRLEVRVVGDYRIRARPGYWSSVSQP